MGKISLFDRSAQPLSALRVDRPGTKGMHPGPVVLPVALAGGAEMTASMRWVSGPVFAQNLCVDAAGAALTLGEITVHAGFSGHLCGDGKGGIVRVELSRFALDSVVLP